MLCTNNSHNLQTNCLFVRIVFQHSGKQFSTLLYLCFLLRLSFKVMQRIGPSQIFPGYVHSPIHVHNLLGSQKYIRAFQSPYEHLISQHFLLSFFFFWSASCLPQLLSLPQAAVILNICCWLILTNALRKHCSHWLSSESYQIKTSPNSDSLQKTFKQVS